MGNAVRRPLSDPKGVLPLISESTDGPDVVSIFMTCLAGSSRAGLAPLLQSGSSGCRRHAALGICSPFLARLMAGPCRLLGAV